MKRFRKRKESAEEQLLTDARHTDGGGAAIDTLCHTKLSARMPVSMTACGVDDVCESFCVNDCHRHSHRPQLSRFPVFYEAVQGCGGITAPTPSPRHSDPMRQSGTHARRGLGEPEHPFTSQLATIHSEQVQLMRSNPCCKHSMSVLNWSDEQYRASQRAEMNDPASRTSRGWR
jgi:hypothetical protein